MKLRSKSPELTRVRFKGDSAVVGTLVPCPEWSLNTDMHHIVWDGDEYLCVLRPDDVEILKGGD